jgi:hypothetical protein
MCKLGKIPRYKSPGLEVASVTLHFLHLKRVSTPVTMGLL